MPGLSTSQRMELWQEARFREYVTNAELRRSLIGDASLIANTPLIKLNIMQQFTELVATYDGDIEGVLDDAEIPTQYSTPINDAERNELTYLRDLDKLCNKLRTAIITMKGTSEAAYAIQDFLRLRDRMDWQGYESYGDDFNGKAIKEKLNNE